MQVVLFIHWSNVFHRELLLVSCLSCQVVIGSLLTHRHAVLGRPRLLWCLIYTGLTSFTQHRKHGVSMIGVCQTKCQQFSFFLLLLFDLSYLTFQILDSHLYMNGFFIKFKKYQTAIVGLFLQVSD